MEARAYLKFARISPRKVQIVLDLIRKQPADKAMAILKNTPKAACEDLQKLLKSAMLMQKIIIIWMFPGSTWRNAFRQPGARSSSASVPERRVARSVY